MFTVLRVLTPSDVSTVTMLSRWADGSEWYMIGLWEMKDGRLWRGTTYYATVRGARGAHAVPRAVLRAALKARRAG
jgi:hypothetical protein